MSCDRTQSLDLAAFVADPTAPELASFREHYPTCAECAREVERWTQLESQLRAAGGAAGHPDTDSLWALERRPDSLDAPLRATLVAHLSGCAPCRSEVAALRGFDFGARQPVPLRTRPTPGGAPMRLRRARRWAIAAALVLLALVAYVAREAARAPEPERNAATPTLPRPIARDEAPAPAPAPAPPTPKAVAQEAPVENPTERAPDPEPEIAREVARSEPEAPVAPAPPPKPRVEPERAASRPREIAMAFPSEPLLYTAPGGADPAIARLRVPTVVRGGGSTLPRIQALAPEHVGLTAEAAPTLYWSIAAATDQRIEIVVTDERAEKPLVDHAQGGARAGTHAFPLSQYGVTLNTGTTYRWYVSIVPDPNDRTSEVVSGGAVRRVALDPELAAQLAGSEAGRRAHLLASAGLFYDAFDTLSTWVARYPEAPEPRRDRRSLLAAVGLGSVLSGEPPGSP